MHKSNDTRDDIRVRLKPLFGIKPGIYLTVIYSLILLIILFFLFFYKGIIDQGIYLKVNTFPKGAVLSIDGSYAGSTPCVVLVKKGKRSVSIEKPFFRKIDIDETFKGPVFATLFFRPKKNLDINLTLTDPAGLVTHALNDFSANPNIPEIHSQTIESGYYNPENDIYQELCDFLYRSMYFVTNPDQLHSLALAFFRNETHGQLLSPTVLLNTVNKIIQFKENYENFPFWVLLSLPNKSAQNIAQSSWFINYFKSYMEYYDNEFQDSKETALYSSIKSIKSIKIMDMTFRYIPEGTLVQGWFNNTSITHFQPYPVHIKPFFMTETEVTNKLYKKFIDENPDWGKVNIDKLVSEKIVSEDYLAHWTGNSFTDGEEMLPIVNVSYYAANAFCSWFSSQKKDILPVGYTVRLPYESEWEWAARGGLSDASYPVGEKPGNAVFFKQGITRPYPVGSSDPNNYGLKDMSGNVWEWCLDWYSPSKYLLSSWNIKRNTFYSENFVPHGSERCVRGGSWVNKKELVKIHTRASQPDSWCTPFLGFRIILSRFHY